MAHIFSRIYFRRICVVLSTIMAIGHMVASPAPPTGYVTTTFPASGGTFFPTWDDGWQLPAAGQGVVTFTVSPASLEYLRGVTILFSSVKEVAGGMSGGVDADNFWTNINGPSNTDAAVYNGFPSFADYHYWYSNPALRVISQSNVFVAGSAYILENATAGIAYDIRVTLDAPHNFFKVETRQSGAGSYQILYLFRGTSLSFPIPSNALFFSFSNWDTMLTYTNIAVSSLSDYAPTFLDGRVLPVCVDSMYTFTDGEYALGSVYFRQGFEVPAGKTAYIGVNKPIGGPINLNGTGKIILSDTLTLGPASSGFTNGGIVMTTDGNEGVISFGAHTDLSQQLILKNSMRFDLNGYVLQLRSDGSNHGALMIDNTISQTLSVRNGYLRGIEDFSGGFVPRLRATTPLLGGGRHGYAFKNITMQFMTDGTMTATSFDLNFKGFNNNFECINQAVVLLGKGLYIDDLAQLTLNSGIELRLDTTLASSYFFMGHGSVLALKNAIFSYNKSVVIPSPSLTKDMISTLSIEEGVCKIRALGLDDDRHFIVGGSSGAYDHDIQLDIFPAALMQLENVAFINNNTNSRR